jgi:hypothetical protein
MTSEVMLCWSVLLMWLAAGFVSPAVQAADKVQLACAARTKVRAAGQK